MKTKTTEPGSLPRSVSRSRRAELAVMLQVATYGGFSIFWVTDNDRRARAAMRLEKRGEIVRKRGRGFGRYPWMGYKLRSANGKAH